MNKQQIKATIYDIDGKKKSEVTLPLIFNTPIREDLAKKYFETNKIIQPYTHDPRAGRKHSASGTISHQRHDWKAHYGRGISRIPRKTMWRRGTQFYWIGAEISSTRGGRRVHGPHGIGKEKKINKKEQHSALNIAFAATASKEHIINRYATLKKLELNIPLIIETTKSPIKTKTLTTTLKTIFPNLDNLIFKNKKQRAGKGKLRGRKYKSNAGLLFITGSEEKIRMNTVDVKPIHAVTISDLYPLGRLTLYTQAAIEELSRETKQPKKEDNTQKVNKLTTKKNEK